MIVQIRVTLARWPAHQDVNFAYFQCEIPLDLSGRASQGTIENLIYPHHSSACLWKVGLVDIDYLRVRIDG